MNRTPLGCSVLLSHPPPPLQGMDGRERGEEDTTFERQATLFAMAAADVLVVSLRAHCIDAWLIS